MRKPSVMRITLVKGNPRIELDKRQHVPYKVEDDCPKCRRSHMRDLSQGGGPHGHHLSYPVIGKPTSVHFVCDDEKCAHEWTRRVVVDVTLREA